MTPLAIRPAKIKSVINNLHCGSYLLEDKLGVKRREKNIKKI